MATTCRTELACVAPSGVHSWGDDLKVLKINALPVSAQVIDLKSFHNRTVDVFVVPLVRIDFLAVLVLEGPVARRVLRPNPFPAAAFSLGDMAKKPRERVSSGAPSLGNFFH